MPPGLSHRDRDPQWHDRKFDRGDERGDREHAQFHTNGGRVGNLGYARTWLMGMPAFWSHCL